MDTEALLMLIASQVRQIIELQARVAELEQVKGKP